MKYTIKEMSRMSGLPASTLRYYDKLGLLPNLERDEFNNRIFTDDDYRQLQLIECLKRSGLSLNEIADFINLSKKGDASLKKRLDLFTKRRGLLMQEMAELQEILKVIEYKCWYYTKACEAGTEAAVKDLKLSEIPEEFREAKERLLGVHDKQI